MRFWFEHSSDIPLRQQLVTQVTLGILSGDLAPNERLPSIRELARRFALHPNTISAGYRQLEAEHWVISRRGSGVYIRPTPPTQATSQDPFDRQLRNLFAAAHRLNLTDDQVVARVTAWPTANPPGTYTHLLLVEPDLELSRIIVAELNEAAPAIPLAACTPTALPPHSSQTLYLSLPSKTDSLRTTLAATSPANTGQPARIHTLPIRSIPASLVQHLPQDLKQLREGLLIAIASRWPPFLHFAQTMLVATGLSPDSLILRDPTQPNWHQGLTLTAAVLTDLPTATELTALSPTPIPIIFRILAEGASTRLLSEICQPPQPVQNPLTPTLQKE